MAPLRAAARIASRNTRRSLRRSVLIVAMVALPVALATATGTVARTIVGTPEEEVAATMGSADLILLPGRRFDTNRMRSRLPSGSQVVALRTEDVGLVRKGELVYASLIEPDRGIASPVLHGMYDLGRGQAPVAPGEAAVNERLLALFDARLGDHLEVGDYRLTVTGTVVTRDLDHPVAIVGKETLSGGFRNVLVDLPAGVPVNSVADDVKVARHDLNTRDEVAALAARDATTWEAVSVVGAVLALFCTGLIAAAAFVVGARRQLRELGLVGAIGGEPRHVRSVVWLGGTTLGTVGALLGSVLGVVSAFALHPMLPRFVGRMVGPVKVNPLLVVAMMLVGVVGATLAALAPARAAGKLSVMDAIAGRMPPPRGPGRVAAFGLMVLVVGGALSAWGTIDQGDEILAVGVVTMVVGILLAIPLLIATVGRFTNFLPTTARLAARDAGRHGRKTGAAVAAGVIALAVPVAVSAYSLSEETYERSSPRLFDNELLIGTFSEVAKGASPAEISAAFGHAFPEASVVPLEQAVPPQRRHSEDGTAYVAVRAPGELGGETTGGDTIVTWPLFVGDARLLEAIGAEEGEAAIEDGRALVLGGYDTKNGFVRVGVASRREGQSANRIAATVIDSPPYFNEEVPKIVISHSTAKALGLETRILNHLFTAPSALSSDQVARARTIAEGLPGVFVRSNDDFLPPYSTGRAAATAASIPLALAILAVAVALVASESRRSHQILAAIGAGPMTHRKLVAATAGLLAGMTALLAIPAGFLPTAVVQLASQSDRPIVVPWATFAITLSVVPLLAALVSGVVARAPKLGSLLTPST